MIHVLFKFANNPYGGEEVDVTSGSGFWFDLSPFLLDASKYGAKCFENLWQYSKVYKEFITSVDGYPNASWDDWQRGGFANPRAVRYPMGKGVKPEYLLWRYGLFFAFGCNLFFRVLYSLPKALREVSYAE